MNHFSKSTLNKLARKGIAVIGIVAIPDYSTSMPWANASTGYKLDDNGTHRIRTFSEVLALAKAGA